MSLLRKLLVGIISFALVLGIYVFYISSSGIPPIESDPAGKVVDANFPDFKGEGGKIDKTNIDHLVDPRYTHRDPNTKKIDREFGFDELIRTIGDVWEVNEPWMKVYQQNFKYHITADMGITELETIVGSTSPKDASFVGNVVIHIESSDPNSLGESFIYLDNLIFQSEKSQFSTAGPVKFLSKDLQMLGRGLEFVYNDQTERIDYLRIVHLDTLRIRSAESTLLSRTSKQSAANQPEPAQSTTKLPPAKVAAAPAPHPAAKPTKPKTATSTAPAVEQTKAQRYKCILSKNVLIDTPEHLVFAYEDISIVDILWSKKPAEQPTDANAPAPAVVVADAYGPRPNPPTEPNDPNDPIVEIVVTCDNGILLVPMDSRRSLIDFPAAETTRRRPDVFDDPNGRTTFLAERIDYNAETEDAVAHNKPELIFFSGDVMDADPNQTSAPVTVTSTDRVRFLRAANQVVFEGDCLLTTPQQGLSEPRDIRLSASKFTLNMPEDANDSPHVVAAGPVELILHRQDSNSVEPPTPVIITAQDQAVFMPDSNQVIFDGNCLLTSQDAARPEHNFTLTSPQLIANLPKKDADSPIEAPDMRALGPVKLAFLVGAFNTPADANTSTVAQAKSDPLPATITASKQAHFLPASNQIIFQGDCKATVIDEDPNFVEEFTLMAQQITIDLLEDVNDASSGPAGGMKYLKAFGGVVRLATKKTAGGKQLSGIELICRQFDYDPNEEVFRAFGPGQIRLASTQQPDPNKQSAAFSLNKPCGARIENFDTLTYFIKDNRIIAHADTDALLVRYVPIENGKIGDLHIVTANHVVVNLIDTPTGDKELATLTASGGVRYQSKDNEFIGGEFFYDRAAEMLIVVGSEQFPCLYNGVLTDKIEYNTRTGEIKAELVAPGTLK